MRVRALLCLAIGCCSATSYAQKPVAMRMAPVPFSGADYSGVYECRGMDSREGPYNGTVTLELVPGESHGEFGAYRFKLELAGYAEYVGQAAARGREMGVSFANTNPAGKDYGTGIASFAKGKDGKWSFSRYYYEPEYKGGNFGTETCFRR